MLPLYQFITLISICYPCINTLPLYLYVTLVSIHYPYIYMLPLYQYTTLISICYPCINTLPLYLYVTLVSIHYPYIYMLPLYQYTTLISICYPCINTLPLYLYVTLVSIHYPYIYMLPLYQYITLISICYPCINTLPLYHSRSSSIWSKTTLHSCFSSRLSVKMNHCTWWTNRALPDACAPQPGTPDGFFSKTKKATILHYLLEDTTPEYFPYPKDAWHFSISLSTFLRPVVRYAYRCSIKWWPKSTYCSQLTVIIRNLPKPRKVWGVIAQRRLFGQDQQPRSHTTSRCSLQ